LIHPGERLAFRTDVFNGNPFQKGQFLFPSQSVMH
jgi:hypothetical protein